MKARYENKNTGFIVYNKPMIHKFYWMTDNDVYAVIDVDDNWRFTLDVINPGKRFGYVENELVWSSEEIEWQIVRMVPPNRSDTLKRLGMTRYDTAEMLYLSRGIRFNSHDWFAWSIEDKFEDYHPMFHTEGLKGLGTLDE